MKIQNSQFLSLEQLQDQYLNQNRQIQSSVTQSGLRFQDILTQKTEVSAENEVKFSKHAANRLVDRNIELTKEQVERLNQGTAIVDSLAFIVNVPNNTVITAMDKTETDENVFTNIDGAVIM